MSVEKQAIFTQTSPCSRQYMGTGMEVSDEYSADDENGQSWLTGTLLIVTYTLGMGMLIMPMEFERMGGVFESLAIQVLIIFMMATTGYIVVYCAEMDSVDTYDEVLEYMCGRHCQMVASFCMMTTMFVNCVTLLIVVGDVSDTIFVTLFSDNFCHHLWYLDRRLVIAIVVVVIIWPLTIFKHLDALKYFNSLGIVIMIYSCLFLPIYEYVRLDVNPVPLNTHTSSVAQMLSALPLVCYSYQSHFTVLPIYATIKRRDSQYFCRSITVSLIILFIIHTLSATFGYLTFGGKVVSDVLKLYHTNDPIVLMGMLAIVLKVIITYPQMICYGRDSYFGLFNAERSPEEIGFGKCVYITTVINTSILILSLLIPNIILPMAFVGSLTALTALAFPGLCLFALANSDSAKMTWNRVTCIFMAIYGIFVTLFGIALFLTIFLYTYNDLDPFSIREAVCHL